MLPAISSQLVAGDVDVGVVDIVQAPGMEGDVTLPYRALDTGAHLRVLADTALEGIPGRVEKGTIDGLHSGTVDNEGVGEPSGTLDMAPPPFSGLLKGPSSMTAQAAFGCPPVIAFLTYTTEPTYIHTYITQESGDYRGPTDRQATKRGPIVSTRLLNTICVPKRSVSLMHEKGGKPP